MSQNFLELHIMLSVTAKPNVQYYLCSVHKLYVDEMQTHTVMGVGRYRCSNTIRKLISGQTPTNNHTFQMQRTALEKHAG